MPLSHHFRCAAATALLWLATGPVSSTLADSASAHTDCINATDASHLTLLGHWRAQFSAAGALQPLPTTAELELWPHPELSASVRGRVLRSGSEVLVAGDVDQGDFTLEESINGTNISATWIGQIVQGSCGKEIRGTWSQEQPPLSLPFVLRKKQ